MQYIEWWCSVSLLALSHIQLPLYILESYCAAAVAAAAFVVVVSVDFAVCDFQKQSHAYLVAVVVLYKDTVRYVL